ncbi:MAG: trypsin-like serine protease [Reyranella sp.]|nr:trypsin-like serine protease [Reyranella sp.]
MLQKPSGSFFSTLGSTCGVLLLAISLAHAQVKTSVKAALFPPEPSEAVVFRSVANEGPELKTGEALVTHPVKTLEGATARAYWPASFFFNYKASDGHTYPCSGTLVGSRTLLTAAHCIPSSKVVTLFNQDTKFNVSCEKNPAFRRDDVASCFEDADCPAASDVALCFLSNEPIVQRLEVISPPSASLSIGRRTLISGFGCVNQVTSGGGSSLQGDRQVLTVGWAAIARSWSAGNALVQLLSDADLSVPKPAGQAANAQLCKGDSGGATYTAGTDESQWDQRAILGVNSFYFGRASYVVSVSSPSIRDFMKKQADKRSTDICGVTDATSTLCGRSLAK